MKASLKFREDELPLFGAKLPFTLAGAPLVSGMTAGNSRDLRLYLGTFFEAGPCCKVAYKPNSSAGPLSFVLKTGSGLWGSPVGAAIAMTAEFRLSGKGGPFFSVSVKPRVGDFCLRKCAKSLLGKPSYRSADFSLEERGFGAFGVTPPSQLEKNSLSIPVSNRDTRVHLHKAETFSIGLPESVSREATRNLFSKSNEPTGPNLYFKAEVVDRENIVGERKIKVDSLKDQGIEGMSDLSKRGFIVDASNGIPKEKMPDIGVHETGKPNEIVSSKSASFDACLGGWCLNAHSSLPLGKQAKLNIRWGLKVPSTFSPKLPGFSVTSLPFLLMDKISIESVNPTVHATLPGNLGLNELSSYSEYGLLPTGSIDDVVHVTATCRSMKRQVELLYAENTVLRRAMEEMGAEIEYRRGIDTWKTAGSVGGVSVQKDNISPSHLLENPQNYKKNEINRRDSLGKKNGRDLSRKETPFDSTGVSLEKSFSLGGLHSEASEELKKAMKTSPSSPFGEKTDRVQNNAR
eukprot:c28685_g1_i4 orf=268-1821(+)